MHGQIIPTNTCKSMVQTPWTTILLKKSRHETIVIKGQGMIVKPTGSAMVHGFRAQVSDSGFRLRGGSFGNHDPNIKTP